MFKLIIQQIPKDPYAPPHTGIYRVIVQRSNQLIINHALETKIQTVAFADFLARQFFIASRENSVAMRGTGCSGLITIDEPGQAILERNSVIITDATIEVRCFVGLPADGRSVLSDIAMSMLLIELPEILDLALMARNVDRSALLRHIATAEDAEFLRNQLDALIC